jgi:hypothetical protein
MLLPWPESSEQGIHHVRQVGRRTKLRALWGYVDDVEPGGLPHRQHQFWRGWYPPLPLWRFVITSKPDCLVIDVTAKTTFAKRYKGPPEIVLCRADLSQRGSLTYQTEPAPDSETLREESNVDVLL